MRRAILIGIFLFGAVAMGACQNEGKGSTDRSKVSSSGEKGRNGPVQTACKDEIQKFCAGEQRVGRCLRERDAADLSPACSTALANRGSIPR